MNKNYLSPDYHSDEEDDDDDYIYDDDDPVDEGELDKQQEEIFNNSLKQNNNMVTSSPFGNGNNNKASSSIWGTTQQPHQNPFSSPFSSPPSTSPWRTPVVPPNNVIPNQFGSQVNNNGYVNPASRKELDRTKNIVFCDVLDCLIETMQSNGYPGLLPRGIYDLKFRFDVWNKLGCLGVKRIYAIVPEAVIAAANKDLSWKTFLDYIACSITEYLKLPTGYVQIITKDTLIQESTVIKDIVDGSGVDKLDILYIGLNSGNPGQGIWDKSIADRLGIDYIDFSQFMNLYN